jgi:putative resolvase
MRSLSRAALPCMRASSLGQKEDLERQRSRLKDYAAAKGYQVAKLELIFQGETGDELVDDFVAVITSMAARIYGRRQSKRRAEKIKQCVEHVRQSEEDKRC